MNPTIQDPSGRGAQRLDWARGALGDPYAQLERASMDAGFRSYWRS
ncbi:MAG TPA: aminoglycoside phosphotransferase, partial [Pseudoxanthomonas sp.]